MRSCVIVVENLPVPLDRRVWQEALALKRSGWDVSVICPRTKRHPEKRLELDGIEIYRHSMPREGRGLLGYVMEYATALFHQARLLAEIYQKKPFDVIHICNPPDMLFLNVLPYKRLGVRVIFDHHDICPELFVSKYGMRGPIHSVLEFLERQTFNVADVVISANDTFRDLAISRGGKEPGKVFTVYSVPDLSRFKVIPPQRHEAGPVVIGYVGVIGKQDGVDNLINAVIELKERVPSVDVLCRIVGDGPELNDLKQLVQSKQAQDLFDFTGFVSGEELMSQLGSFAIGVIPDPPDEYNDKISMNKVFEYSAIGLPIIAFRLSETTRLLGDAAIYAAEATPAAMAAGLRELVLSPELRAHYGAKAASRFASRFDWNREAMRLVEAYDCAVVLREKQVEILAQ